MISPGDVVEAAFVPPALIGPSWDAAGDLAESALAIEDGAADSSSALVAVVRHFGQAGLLGLIAPRTAGGTFESVRSVALCLTRERLGFSSPLLDLAFTMQGLGSHPIVLAGDEEQQARHLPGVLTGEHVAAFALTEPGAGSDLGGIATTATREGDQYVLQGEKIWISNAPIADIFTVFAATAPEGARRRLSAFVVRRGTPGLSTEAQKVLGGHPIGRVRLDGVRVPAIDRLGAEGDGMRAALGTLHRFRTTVGAAAVGFAARALVEATDHVKTREQFGAPLAALQAVQMRIADMACDVDASRLLVYRAAALADAGAPRDEVSRCGSMAKLVATESAQRVIDHGVQLLGGRGVAADGVLGRLYQEVRALRIYEGTTDVQKMLIARAVLDA
ncbi:MAG: acyl-CoA dehydrogenase family protein [Deltaproteobacteria bacterium]|nr:acyl-CoA dehydrogenase family protein [Deltaproteobacteria bacterium]